MQQPLFGLLLMEHNGPVIDQLIVGGARVILIQVGPEGQQHGVAVVQAVVFALGVAGG